MAHLQFIILFYYYYSIIIMGEHVNTQADTVLEK